MLKHVYFFIDEDGSSPIEGFLDELTEKENLKGRAYLKILKDLSLQD